MRKGAYIKAAVLIIGLFHLGTINFPPLTFDEAFFVDYALHGHWLQWQLILPSGQGMFLDTAYFGIIKAHIAVIKTMIDLFGVAMAPIRIGNIAAGLVGLLLIAMIFYRLGTSSASLTWLSLFALSGGFFFRTHICRPEGFIFLFFVINLFWLIINRGRIMGAAAGFLLTFALAFHIAAIIPLAGFSVLMAITRQDIRRPRMWWWVAGAMAGIIVFLNVVEIESLVLYSQLARQTYQYSEPPLLRWKWDILAIFFNGFSLITPIALSKKIPWEIFLGWAFVASTIIQFRRRADLPGHEKWALLITLSLMISYGTITGSPSKYYHLYFYPFFFLLIAFLVEALWKNKYRPSGIDLLIVSLSGLSILFSQDKLNGSSIAAIAAFCGLLAWLFGVGFKMSPKRACVAAMIALFIVVLWNVDCFFQLIVETRHHLQRNPAFAGFFIWPLATLPLFKFRQWNRAMAAGFVFFCAAYIGFEAKAFGQLGKAATAFHGNAAAVAAIPDKRRVVGPEMFWVFQPSVPTYSTSALLQIKKFHPTFNMAMALYDFKPTCIYWPVRSLPALVQDGQSASDGKIRVETIERPGSRLIVEDSLDVVEVRLKKYH